MSDVVAPESTAWYRLSAEEVLAKQNVTSTEGLSDAEVTKRRDQYGPNRLAEQPPEPGWKAFLRQYRDLMQLVLIGVAVISIVALQDFATGIFVLALTVFNALLGLNQEGKAAESV